MSPRPRKNIAAEGQAVNPPAATDGEPNVLITTDGADLAARVSQIDGRYDVDGVAQRIAAGDFYGLRFIFEPPDFFDLEKASCRFCAWRGEWKTDLDNLTDPVRGNHGFPYAICTRANINDWCYEGREDEVVFGVHGAFEIRDQIMLYMPRTIFRAWQAWKDRHSAGVAGQVMGKNKHGLKTADGLEVFYSEGDGTFKPGRDHVIAEDTDESVKIVDKEYFQHIGRQ